MDSARRAAVPCDWKRYVPKVRRPLLAGFAFCDGATPGILHIWVRPAVASASASAPGEWACRDNKNYRYRVKHGHVALGLALEKGCTGRSEMGGKHVPCRSPHTFE